VTRSWRLELRSVAAPGPSRMKLASNSGWRHALLSQSSGVRRLSRVTGATPVERRGFSKPRIGQKGKLSGKLRAKLKSKLRPKLRGRPSGPGASFSPGCAASHLVDRNLLEALTESA